MPENEFRKYTLSGELPPENWELLVGMLGQTGLQAERHDYELPGSSTVEQPSDDEIKNGEQTPAAAYYASREDLQDYVVSLRRNKTLASRTWNDLERQFGMSQYPNLYAHFMWFKNHDTSVVPENLFANVTYSQANIPYHHSNTLNIQALATYLRAIDERLVDRPADRKLLKSLLGQNASFASFDTLKGFVSKSINSF